MIDHRNNNESNCNNFNKMQETAERDVYRRIDSILPDDSTIDGQRQPSPFDLDKIITKYGENSEILQLILISKVEEDRRRAEEAKLKQKKIEYLVSGKGNVIQTSILFIFTKIFIIRTIASYNILSTLQQSRT